MQKTILVMSGKGGVGKTTIAVNLAYRLFMKGNKVGLLDVDIHGPNALQMLGYPDVKLGIENKKLIPLMIKPNFKIASIAGYIDKESAVIWRGPRKHNAISQLINDVDWGELDYLIIDFPPGTGDEHISVVQLLKEVYGAIIISTPQGVSLTDMLRSIDFCKNMNVPVIGTIENMSGGIFGKDTVSEKATEKGLNFLGKIPLCEEIINSSESEKSFLDNENTDLNNIFDEIISKVNSVKVKKY